MAAVPLAVWTGRAQLKSRALPAITGCSGLGACLWQVVSSGSPCLFLLDLEWFPAEPCIPRGEEEPEIPL